MARVCTPAGEVARRQPAPGFHPARSGGHDPQATCFRWTQEQPLSRFDDVFDRLLSAAPSTPSQRRWHWLGKARPRPLAATEDPFWEPPVHRHCHRDPCLPLDGDSSLEVRGVRDKGQRTGRGEQVRPGPRERRGAPMERRYAHVGGAGWGGPAASPAPTEESAAPLRRHLKAPFASPRDALPVRQRSRSASCQEAEGYPGTFPVED